jgi:hypothetical protein
MSHLQNECLVPSFSRLSDKLKAPALCQIPKLLTVITPYWESSLTCTLVLRGTCCSNAPVHSDGSKVATRLRKFAIQMPVKAICILDTEHFDGSFCWHKVYATIVLAAGGIPDSSSGR